MNGSLRTRAILRWLILALLWFGPLNTPHLFEPDEGRYAEIPREMVASGDWVTPRLDGIKYFEKPALQYWATATAFTLFGQHAWTARLWSGAERLTSGCCSLLRWRVDSTMSARRNWPCWCRRARCCTSDWRASPRSICALCFSLQLAMCALALLVQQRTRAPSAAASARALLPMMLGIGVALAVLSKGLVGILIPRRGRGALHAMRRDWRCCCARGPGGRLLALLVLAAPWFVLVSLRNPEFAHFFFVFQHFQRYLSTRWVRSLPAGVVLHAGAGRWASCPGRRCCPAALLRGMASGARGRERATRAAAGLGGVRVGVLQPVAVQARFRTSCRCCRRSQPADWARHLASLPPPRLARHLTRGRGLRRPECSRHCCCCWQLPAAAALAARASTGSIIGSCRCLAAAGARPLRSAARTVPARNRPMAAAAAAGLGGVAAGAVRCCWRPNSCRACARGECRTAMCGPGSANSTRLYCVNGYLQPLPFYLRRTCTLVGYRGELDFGLQQEPARWIPDLAQFERRWRSRRCAGHAATRGLSGTGSVGRCRCA